MSRNCAFLSVDKYSFIVTCIKDLSFLVPCLLSAQFPSFIFFLEGMFSIVHGAVYSVLVLRTPQLDSDLCHVTEVATFCQSPFPILLYHVSTEPGAAGLFSGTLTIPACVWSLFLFFFPSFHWQSPGLGTWCPFSLPPLVTSVTWSTRLLHGRLWVSQTLHVFNKVPIPPLCNVPVCYLFCLRIASFSL